MVAELKWGATDGLTPGAPQSPYAYRAWTKNRKADEREMYCGFVAIDATHDTLCAGVKKVGALNAAFDDDFMLEIKAPQLTLQQGARGTAIPLVLDRDVLDPALYTLAPPEPVASGPSSCTLPPEGAVFIGVIDDAICYAHERFRRRTAEGERSRVDLVWLQGASYDRPVKLRFGREIFGHEINAAMAKMTKDRGRIDETALYRDAGLLAPTRDEPQTAAFRASHGTAVLDVATGFDPDAPEGSTYPIVAVSLPVRITADTSGAFVETYIALGIARILEHLRAREAQFEARYGRTHRYPCVINVSYALSAGPEDRDGMLEGVMRAAVESRAAPLRFVLPAGNHRLARVRARLPLGAGEATLGWRLPPDDRTESFVEFWAPPGTTRFTVGIAPPGAEKVVLLGGMDGILAKAEHAPQVVPLEAGGREIGRAFVSFWGAGEQRRQRVVLQLAHTHADRTDAIVVPPGDWTITARPLNGGEGALDVYVQRDDTLPGLRRLGRQSSLVDPDYRARDPRGGILATDPADAPARVRRAGTLNALGSGGTAVLVGSAIVGTGRSAPYSGLRASGGEPAMLAPSERGVALTGILAAGSRSGGRVPVSGTSFAAPMVARQEAAALAANAASARLAWMAKNPPAGFVRTPP